MVNLAFLGDLYAMGTDYRVNRAKIFFMVFFTIVALVLIISGLFKKTQPKGVEPPMPSNNTIKIK